MIISAGRVSGTVKVESSQDSVARKYLLGRLVVCGMEMELDELRALVREQELKQLKRQTPRVIERENAG